MLPERIPNLPAETEDLFRFEMLKLIRLLLSRFLTTL